MNEDSYNDEEKYHGNRQMSEVSIVDQDQSWAELQSQLYSEEAEKIADSLWRQLRCKTTTLTYNVTWVKCIYIMIAVICIPIGVITYNLSRSVVMQEFAAYDALSDCAITSFSATEEWGKTCSVNYTVENDMDPPIYFHYKLTNFYQNHRSYVKSRSEAQLKNEDVEDNGDCDPSEVKTATSGPYKGLIMLPCGLIANSFFNDKYKVRLFTPNDNGEGYQVVEFCNDTDTCNGNAQDGDNWSKYTWYASPNWENKDIAWKSDVEKKFVSAEQKAEVTTDVNSLQNWQNITLPDTDDQDFIVWMRTATVSEFSKLHRIINGQKLRKGDIMEVTIQNFFTVDSFSGTKSLIITTNSSLGGQNDVLGIAFMTIGSISLLTAVCFRLLIPPKNSGIRSIESDLETAFVMDHQRGNIKQ
eukprot:CAMPEP_0201569842 /NCGR_PEP_ID=MMETSP0190_2-20130828/11753_1 /ASSEMBLY_ACC=CAM_ASM_000263 /TAXON_ID=37353 /ORGANISM="Rosalina sp." /LENGTH=413 /DNA_ID=CAMNT_0047992637 /DNA_START=29 /DNA_END=1270 /DNA_ORIENTATION=+